MPNTTFPTFLDKHTQDPDTNKPHFGEYPVTLFRQNIIGTAQRRHSHGSTRTPDPCPTQHPRHFGLTHSKSKHKQTTFWRISGDPFSSRHHRDSAKTTSPWINADPGSMSNTAFPTFLDKHTQDPDTNKSHFGEYPVPSSS